jgi:hypothetical protein
MSWHVVLAAIGAVLSEPSGRIGSPALARDFLTATDSVRPDGDPAQRREPPGPVSGLWCS